MFFAAAQRFEQLTSPQNLSRDGDNYDVLRK